MSVRKKLQNKEKFKFDENDILPPLPQTVSQKSSVQSRLFKKAGSQVGSIDSARSISLASPRVMTFKNLNQVNNNTTETLRGDIIEKDDESINNNYNNDEKFDYTKDPVLMRIVSQLMVECENIKKKEIPVTKKQETVRKLEQEKETGSCPCDRPLCLVMCVLCKASSPGRVSLPCVQHPRAVFLQDLQCCSSCKQGDQTNLVEFEMPRGMKEAMQNVASKK